MHYTLKAGLFSLGLISVAASAQSETNWSGHYAGVAGTYVLGNTTLSSAKVRRAGNTFFEDEDITQLSKALPTLSANEHRFGATVFGGSGRQLGNRYFGWEASASLVNLNKAQSASAAYNSLSSISFDIKTSAKMDWTASLRLRAGIARDRWLGYVTAGPAVGQIELEASYRDNWGANNTAKNSVKKTRVGYAVGVGGEYDLDGPWSLKAEYLYADLGKVDTPLAFTTSGSTSYNGALDSSFEVKMHTVSLGLAYRF